jgi:glycosyltransferase involved in cell wall biosynthesis
MKKKIALIAGRPGSVSGVSVLMNILHRELSKYPEFQVDVIRPEDSALRAVSQIGYLAGYFLLREKLEKYDVIIGNSVGLVGAVDAKVPYIYNAHTKSVGGNLAMRRAFETLPQIERHYLHKVTTKLCDATWRVVGEALTNHNVVFEIDQLLSRKANLLVSVSDEVNASFIEHYGLPRRKTQIVYNAIDDLWLQPREIHEDVATDRPNVVFIGRVSDGPALLFHKGLDRAIAAVHKLRTIRPLFLLHVADLTKKQLFSELLQEFGIDSRLNLENSEVPHYLREGDLYVFTSRTEAFGLVLLEAMASGLVPIAFPSGVAKDIIQDGKNGYLVQSVEEMRKKIEYLSNKPELRKEMGQAARKTVAKKFSVAKMVKGYAQAIHKVLGE